MINEDGETLSNMQEIVNCLGKSFQKVFKDVGNHEFPIQNPKYNNMRFEIDYLEVFSRYNIEKLIKTTDKNKSIGYDNIHPWVLSECSDVISRILELIFIQSYKTGRLPVSWKLANITPIPKRGNSNLSTNYRPISLTSIVCKTMERLLKSKMIIYLNTNSLLNPDQHGFLNGKSCTTNLLEAFDSITETLNRGFIAIIIYLDFAKAFDLVPHKGLALKLTSLGFDGLIHDWIMDFLVGRKQRVTIGKYSSDWVDVKSGVPQGSVLGPLLFLIFINDMPELLHHLSKLFADDSKLLAEIKNELDLIMVQTDLNSLVDWSNNWLMDFNLDKCKVMKLVKNKKHTNFGQRQLLEKSFYMTDTDGNRHVLEETNFERDLGVYVSDDMKWSKHIQQIASKASSVMGSLKRTFSLWNVFTFKKLFTCFVRPHLEYCV